MAAVPASDADLARFEAVRAGDAAAFDALVGDHLPGMTALAACYVPAEEVDAVVVDAFAALLAGVDLFAWRCSLRAWVFGLLVDAGRARVREGAEVAPSPLPSTPAVRAVVEPADWRDLPWGARWGSLPWDVAHGALLRMPLGAREAVWLRDVAGWPERDVCDALALTQVRTRALLAVGRGAVRDALAALVGSAEPTADVRARQVAAAAHLLGDLMPSAGPLVVPAALQTVFRRWRAARRRWWRRRFGGHRRPRAARPAMGASVPVRV